MRDEGGEVIYVGKARELRSRVRSYFGSGDGRYQIEYLMQRVRAIEKIVTNTEEEAFLLERDLINRMKPRYNIRLKDDKSYLSVRIDPNADWPRIETVRKVQTDGALYFGPYTSSFEVKAVLDVIREVIPLRSCTNTVFYNRQRPCLEYQIKRCAGPCCLPVDREQYMGWVDQAIEILRGKPKNIVARLEEAMEEASVELRFEEAAALRDRIAVLEQYASGARSVPVHHGESRDAVGIYREGERAVVCILKVRFGRISDTAHFSLEHVEIDDEELLEAVISQYYEADHEVPDEVVLPFEFQNQELVRKSIASRKERAVEFNIPKIGSKARLVRLAELNAKQEFATKFDIDALYDKISRAMALAFSLQQIPRRIECIDISNLQGSDIVGAVVVFYDGLPQKQAYKRYKIHSEGKPDDFAAVHEVVLRRLQRSQDEENLPDLIIIDGGPGQLRSALEARNELGLQVEIISMAKMRAVSLTEDEERTVKPERIFLPGQEEPVALDLHNDMTRFLQRVRDEVHRFVINYHRKMRGRRTVASVLDDIPGVGPDRKRRLFNEFGSIDRLKDADANHVARAGRMPLPLAEKILKVLRGGQA